MAELNRSELRKKIMTILYQISICENNRITYDVNDLIKNILEIDNDFVKETVYGVITNRTTIDEYANKYLNNWTIDRLGNTDQAILRMGIYELMYTDTPSIVVINEAIELAKLYSDDAVKGMINSVLDKIYHEEKNE
ncbi:MAG: transcription antitermination factor NusB [Bacilli bacterium]|nr:transcription antitermination factor NusB [Bacilli bacterium]